MARNGFVLLCCLVGKTQKEVGTWLGRSWQAMAMSWSAAKNRHATDRHFRQQIRTAGNELRRQKNAMSDANQDRKEGVRRWTLSKDFTFEAAHVLPRHDGKCARLHGHSWKLTVEVANDRLETQGPKTGMVMDFVDIKAAVAPLLESKLDHYYLNDSLEMANPTSENVARWVFDRLLPKLPLLRSVTINETCTSACRYGH